MVFTLKVTGPPEIEAALEDFAGPMIRYGLENLLTHYSKPVKCRHRSEVPVKTGYLRSHIKSERSAMGAKLSARSTIRFVCG